MRQAQHPRSSELPLFCLLSEPEERFLDFHRQNPHVYARLRELCVQVRRRGVRRFGIRTVWERLRWHAQFETSRPPEEWKLNNNYTRHYARLLMAQEPELRGMFETRGTTP
jgi:hypothetical protein